MSSRNKSSKSSTPVKGKSKKLDTPQQLKRQKEDPAKSTSSKGKNKKSTADIKPTAKIPSSRADSSSNWKALLQKQGKTLSTRSSSISRPTTPSPMEASADVKRFRNSAGSESESVSTDMSNSALQSRCSSQLSMASEVTSSTGADHLDTEIEAGASASAVQKNPSQVKQEFRALGLSESTVPQCPSKKVYPDKTELPRHQQDTIRRPPPEGLNEFGYFDYSHYGVLRTPLTAEHTEFMADTGIIAMDCEMVGVGPMRESALARVSIVNEHGYCLYDRFVKPKVEVTDYRTQFSGIRENDLKNAVPFPIVAREVADLLRGHILIGHSLKSDLAVLYLNHPKAKIRDTAFFFKKVLHSKTPKLKMLVKKLLNVEIQQGEHSSITDAQATMALYQLYQKDWEVTVRQSNRGIDVMKITMDEFKLLKSNGGVPPSASLYVNSQLGPKRDWYAPPLVQYNSAPYCNNFASWVQGCSGGSAGSSPSESPPISMNPMGYPPFPCHPMTDEIFPHPSNAFPPNFQYIPCPSHPVQHQPIPPPPSFPFYQFGTMNGGMLIPSMNFPPQPIMYHPPPPPPPPFMPPHPSMMIPVYRPMHCFPLEYNNI